MIVSPRIKMYNNKIKKNKKQSTNKTGEFIKTREQNQSDMII